MVDINKNKEWNIFRAVIDESYGNLDCEEQDPSITNAFMFVKVYIPTKPVKILCHIEVTGIDKEIFLASW